MSTEATFRFPPVLGTLKRSYPQAAVIAWVALTIGRSISWQAPALDEGAIAALAANLKLRPLTARILVGRGIVLPEVAARFLEPRLADLRRPDGMVDLDRALDRLVRALAAGETIGVFGDYDVDGVTTAAVLATALRAFGGRVIARAASRHAGYGLGVEDVDRFAADGCRVLVTGDCGTSDHDALRAARERGIDTIVIDHHEVPTRDCEAYALVNSRRPDDTFPFKGLASCGVAFYLAAALRTRLSASFDPRDLLDLVALGTIADLVPLVDENRILVAAGLKVLSSRRRPAVAALAARAELSETPVISARDVAFRLTPRLNAAGRLGEAQLALDLLLAEQPADAERLAAELEDQNTERQRIQELVWMEALGQATTPAGRACAGRRRRGLASRRRRHRRGASGRQVRAAIRRDRLQERGGEGLGADDRGREPVRGAFALRAAPDQVRWPRERRRDEPGRRSAGRLSGRIRRRSGAAAVRRSTRRARGRRGGAAG